LGKRDNLVLISKHRSFKLMTYAVAAQQLLDGKVQVGPLIQRELLLDDGQPCGISHQVLSQAGEERCPIGFPLFLRHSIPLYCGLAKEAKEVSLLALRRQQRSPGKARHALGFNLRVGFLPEFDHREIVVVVKIQYSEKAITARNQLATSAPHALTPD